MDKYIKSVTARTKNTSYKIIIGESVLFNIKTLDDILLKERFAVIVSARVMELYEDTIKNTFAGYNNFDIFVMRDGEENKNYNYAEEFLYKLTKNGYSRKSLVFAVGGGVVGDFAGFIASIFMRGIPIIHIPTTLLAMVDSSIGGKTAVNLTAGKNIAGAFHQPKLVISDINFIKTLPNNEFKNGLTEVLKTAVIGDNKLLKILLENDLKSIRSREKILKIVYLSAIFKSRIVKKDENEGGGRAILNFGHTAGHAIESLMGYKGIAHGEAVAIGLKIESEISRRIGWLSEKENRIVNDLIKRYGLIYDNFKWDTKDVINHMKYDKKNFSGKLKFVLLKGLGKPVYNQEVDIDLLRDVIDSIQQVYL